MNDKQARDANRKAAQKAELELINSLSAREFARYRRITERLNDTNNVKRSAK